MKYYLAFIIFAAMCMAGAWALMRVRYALLGYFGDPFKYNKAGNIRGVKQAGKMDLSLRLTLMELIFGIFSLVLFGVLLLGGFGFLWEPLICLTALNPPQGLCGQ